MPLFSPATQELFEALCDLPPDVQRRQLAEVTDPDLRAQVERLLALDARAHEVFDTAGGHGWLPDAVATDEAPDALGRYRIIRRVGAGAMGVVYEAEEAHPRRRVALKVLPARVRSPAVLELFRFEAQALAQVEHPGVPAIYEAGTSEDGTVYLSRELVRGVPLDAWARGRSQRAKIELLIQLVEALGAAHRAGVLHRDIKPANVLVAERGPSLLDFGVAAPLARVQEGRQPGTPAYMSPEAKAGEALDEASDLYAVGVVAYELFTGDLPASPPAPLAAGEDLSDVVLRCLRRDPADRPRSADALADDLRRVLALQPLPWKPGRGYRLALWSRRHRRGLGALAAVCAAAVLVGGFGVAQQELDERRRHRVAAEHLQRLEQAVGVGGGGAVGRWRRWRAAVGGGGGWRRWVAAVGVRYFSFSICPPRGPPGAVGVRYFSFSICPPRGPPAGTARGPGGAVWRTATLTLRSRTRALGSVLRPLRLRHAASTSAGRPPRRRYFFNTSSASMTLNRQTQPRASTKGGPLADRSDRSRASCCSTTTGAPGPHRRVSPDSVLPPPVVRSPIGALVPCSVAAQAPETLRDQTLLTGLRARIGLVAGPGRCVTPPDVSPHVRTVGGAQHRLVRGVQRPTRTG